MCQRVQEDEDNKALEDMGQGLLEKLENSAQHNP